MVFECTLNYLVQKIGRQQFVDVSPRKMGCERLVAYVYKRITSNPRQLTSTSPTTPYPSDRFLRLSENALLSVSVWTCDCGIDDGSLSKAAWFDVHLEMENNQTARRMSFKDALWTPARNDAGKEYLFGIVHDVWTNSVYNAPEMTIAT
jgi:hypothetical protein